MGRIKLERSSVREIVALERDASGAISPITLYRRAEKKRKQSKELRPIERAVRDMMRAQSTMAEDYLARHESSNRKKRDGWINDMQGNVFRAMRKGGKKIRILSRP